MLAYHRIMVDNSSAFLLFVPAGLCMWMRMACPVFPFHQKRVIIITIIPKPLLFLVPGFEVGFVARQFRATVCIRSSVMCW